MKQAISSPLQSKSVADLLLMAVEAEEMRRSLKKFVMGAWRFVDPAPYTDGWCVDAICDHLTALTLGHFRFLLINIPPRHSKSTICSVIWPVWVWLQNPSERFLSSSYSLELSARDSSKKRALIESPWFKERYGQDFKLTTDSQAYEFIREPDFALSKAQNTKRFSMNDKLGYQMAVAVASSTTGHGGSILLCLCYNTEVTTDIGRLCIGEIVEKELPVRVLAFDHKSNNVRWQRIDKYEVSPGRPCVRVTLNDGRVIDATTDHPFYVVGRGYVPAAQLTNTDKVITDEIYLRGLRERIRSFRSSCSTRQAPLLQSDLLYRIDPRRESPRLSRRAGRMYLRDLWQYIQSPSIQSKEKRSQFLLPDMLRGMGAKRKTKHLADNSLRDLWEGNQAQALRSEESRPPLLQSCLPEEVSEGCLRDLWEENGKTPVSTSTSRAYILRSSLPLRTNEQDNHSLRSKPNYEVHMRGLRGRVRTVNKSRCQSQASLLRSDLLWSGGTRREQSCIPRWQNRAFLRTMRKGFPLQSRGSFPWKWQILLFFMQSKNVSSKSTSQLIRQLCLLWNTNQTQNTQAGREEELLLSGVRQQGTQRPYQWRKQWEVCGRGVDQPVSTRISSSSSEYQGARWAQMRSLPSNTGGQRQGTGRSSYRLRHLSQRVFKSGISLPMVPREDARDRRAEIPVEALLVRCVEPIPTPEYVYNLQIAVDHNYFAEGILVHNCDDPHAANEAHSEVKREGANTWFRETWSNRMNDANKDKMLVIGQRIHEDDVSGIILRERPDWVHLNLPAEYEPARHCRTYIVPAIPTRAKAKIESFTDPDKSYDVAFLEGKAVSCSCEAFTYHPDKPCKHMETAKCPGPEKELFWEDPRKEEGELLWPERFSHETLNRYKRDLGSMGYSAQYQQSPIPASGGIFKEQNERLFAQSYDTYFLHTPKGIRAVAKSACSVFMTVDPAISEKQSADYTVIATWAQTPFKDLLLLNIRRDHWSHREQQEQIKEEFEESGAEFVAVETIAYQAALFQDLLEKGIFCRPFVAKSDKVLRASGAGIWHENGKFYFLVDAEWLPAYRKELYKFPKAPKDDQVDVTSLAGIVIRSRGPLSEDNLDMEVPDPIEGPPDPLQKSVPLTHPIVPIENPPEETVYAVTPPVHQTDAFAWYDKHYGGDWG